MRRRTAPWRFVFAGRRALVARRVSKQGGGRTGAALVRATPFRGLPAREAAALAGARRGDGRSRIVRASAAYARGRAERESGSRESGSDLAFEVRRQDLTPSRGPHPGRASPSRRIRAAQGRRWRIACLLRPQPADDSPTTTGMSSRAESHGQHFNAISAAGAQRSFASFETSETAIQRLLNMTARSPP